MQAKVNTAGLLSSLNSAEMEDQPGCRAPKGCHPWGELRRQKAQERHSGNTVGEQLSPEPEQRQWNGFRGQEVKTTGLQ